jgi:hypothetical protein
MMTHVLLEQLASQRAGELATRAAPAHWRTTATRPRPLAARLASLVTRA